MFDKVYIEKVLGYEKMVVKGIILLLFILEDRKNKYFNGKLNVKVSIVLFKENLLMDVKFCVDNMIYNYRLCVYIKIDIKDNKNIVLLLFGYIIRENGVLDNWEDIYSEMFIDLEFLESNIMFIN